jgi:predicted phage terminase large subunit-like protein
VDQKIPEIFLDQIPHFGVEAAPSSAACVDYPVGDGVSLTEWAAIALEPWDHKPARHHLKLIEQLEALSAGDIDRLMVLMPPRSAKSYYASMVFPPWWLHRHPGSSIIAASHTADLATNFGRLVRNLIAEHEATLGYRLAGDNRAAWRFSTSARGEYFAAGLGGPITGRRADLVVIDDPIKNRAEADSASHRDHVWDWYRSDLVSRLKPGGRIALIMTRWHQDDLGGRLLNSADGWHTLILPALAGDADPLGRKPGEPLWPEWESLAALERKRAMAGPRAWSAQYQQEPRPDTGALFRVPRIGTVEAEPAGLTYARAWDLAATSAAEAPDPDWTVGLKLGRDGAGRIYVVDLVRLRGGPHEVEEAIVHTAQSDGRAVPVGLPQDPGQAGKQQVAWLTARLAGFRVIASPETGAKLTRASPVAAQVDAGNLTLVRAPWNAAFLDELRDFPQGRKDDQVDALARAFSMLTMAAAAPARRINLSVMAR